MKQVNIYALINPLNNDVFYIGASQNPEKRIPLHLTDARKGTNSDKARLIRSLLELGMKPEQLILETGLTIDETSFFEDFYIDLFRSFGFRLMQERKSNYTYMFNEELEAEREKERIIRYGNKIDYKIKLARRKSHLPMGKAAKKIGIPYWDYYDYETGRREPDLEVLDKIAKALDCDLKIDLAPKP